MHDRNAYRLSPRRVGSGGQAEIYEATRKEDGAIFVLKRGLRELDSADARQRMRREIEVQSALRHPHVMPVLDWDDENYTWYVMPRARRVMSDLATPIETGVLHAIVTSVAEALEVAHERGHPHRDITPRNILEIEWEESVRWVLADWGLTRRPLGETTADLTQTGTVLGTEGYAPPEAYRDAHQIGPSGDIYSLGQLIGWGTTGERPIPNVPATAPEPWRRLVRLMTRREPAERPQSIGAVRVLLDRVVGVESQSDIAALLDRARAGDTGAAVAACLSALERQDDHDLFLDEIASLDGVAGDLIGHHPDDALLLVRAMIASFESFGRRNFDYANVPLRWMHGFARAAAQSGQLELLEDVCDVLFPFEAGWNRFKQRDITAGWLRSLRGDNARVVSQCILGAPDMANYLGDVSSDASADIREALRTARDIVAQRKPHRGGAG